MRIALISTEKLPVPNIKGGAIQTYITGVLPYLSQISTPVVYSIVDPDLPSKSVEANYEVVRLPGNTGKEYMLNVLNQLKKIKFDIIHVFNRPHYINMIHKIFPKVPVTLSIHSNIYSNDRVDTKELNKCMEAVSGIVTVSKYLTDKIIKKYPKSKHKIRHIYEGVDTEVFHPDKKAFEKLRKRFNLKNKPVILNVGRLTPEKGLYLLIQAFPDFTKYFPNAVLIIIGSTRFVENKIYSKHIENVLSSLPENSYIFLQDISPNKIHEFFGIADVLVTTSQWEEPLSRVHYEAMAAGLPIITTPKGGNAEVIKDGWNGLIIEDYENPKSYADCLINLFRNEQLAYKLGKNGRMLAIQHFTWRRVALELKAFLTEVIESNNN